MESVEHLFVKCEWIGELKRYVERILNKNGLNEEEVLYHEGGINSEIGNTVISLFKDAILAVRTDIIHGKISSKAQAEISLRSVFDRRLNYNLRH